MRSTYENR